MSVSERNNSTRLLFSLLTFVAFEMTEIGFPFDVSLARHFSLIFVRAEASRTRIQFAGSVLME